MYPGQKKMRWMFEVEPWLSQVAGGLNFGTFLGGLGNVVSVAGYGLVRRRDRIDQPQRTGQLIVSPGEGFDLVLFHCKGRQDAATGVV